MPTYYGSPATLAKAISRQPFQDPTQNLLTEEMGFKFGVHVPYGMILCLSEGLIL